MLGTSHSLPPHLCLLPPLAALTPAGTRKNKILSLFFIPSESSKRSPKFWLWRELSRHYPHSNTFTDKFSSISRMFNWFLSSQRAPLPSPRDNMQGCPNAHASVIACLPFCVVSSTPRWGHANHTKEPWLKQRSLRPTSTGQPLS